MLVFSTRLPLKDSVEKDICLGIFFKWIIGSPNYNIDKIDYDPSADKDFEFKNDKVSIYVRHFKDVNSGIEITAGRLENNDADTGAVWTNDCIFLSENGLKSVLVQLNCYCQSYEIQLPETVHKPYIVRQIVEGGYCRNDGDIPITDKPLVVDTEYFDTCKEIMLGIHKNSLPCVYLSCDETGKAALNPYTLAKELSGIAHVFREKSTKTSFRLKDCTNRNNVHSRYVGIYFPGTKAYERFTPKDGDNHEDEFINDLYNSVRRALVNRLDSSNHSWNQIAVLQSKLRMLEWKQSNEKYKQAYDNDISIVNKEKEELQQEITELRSKVTELLDKTSEYENLFDTYAKIEEDLNNKIKSLQKDVDYFLEENDRLEKENFSLMSRLNSIQTSRKPSTSNASPVLSLASETELYEGECTDMLISILSQVSNNFYENSRARILISALLADNPKIGKCAEIISTAESVFEKGGKLSGTDKSTLRNIGFVIDDDTDGHTKLTYNNDPRTLCTVSGSPSDKRTGKNLAGDIRKKLDVEKKLFE